MLPHSIDLCTIECKVEMAFSSQHIPSSFCPVLCLSNIEQLGESDEIIIQKSLLRETHSEIDNAIFRHFSNNFSAKEQKIGYI